MKMNALVRWAAVGALTLMFAAGVAAEDREVESGDDPKLSDTKKANVRVLSNQRFGSAAGKEGLCDVYQPAGAPPPSGHPVVMIVHGGGWISGDKWTVAGYSRLLADAGFVAVTINYRLAPKYKFPVQVDDVREALVWIVDNAERFSIDTDRVGLFGYSAGGHLSTLVASVANEPMSARLTTSNWPASDSRWKKLPTIRAVCAGGPPCDFRSWPIDNTTLAYFLGGSRRQKPDVYAAASPAEHVSAKDPPTQIIHGAGDLLVPIKDSLRFHEAQKEAGIDARFQTIPKQGHMMTFMNPKTSDKMLEFFGDVLSKPEETQAP